MKFDDPDIHEKLDLMDSAGLNALPFGVVGLDADNTVEIYNIPESKFSGLAVDHVVGRHFFHAVAPCMNNYLVAERLNDEPLLDATIPYVLTFRVRHTPVHIRLLRQPDRSRRWVLINRD
jgi:photoactive yellow protein